MKNIAKYIAVASLVFSAWACDDLFEPAIENIMDENKLDTDPRFVDQVLGSAYILMPYPSVTGENNAENRNDVATDDAVSNNINSAYLTMATGGWTARTGKSVDNWRDRNASIQFVNLVLKHVDNAVYAKEEVTNNMFRDRLKGEAYGLRALNMYFLLQNYAGVSASGELLGVHIWTEPYTAETDMNVPRNTFAECMTQLLDDVKKASELLPYEYADAGSLADVPAKYQAAGATLDAYNRVFGASTFLRMSGRIAQAIGAQAALLAASPAFSNGSGVTWEMAANQAAAVLDYIGGPAGLPKNGHIWYSDSEVGNTPTEIVSHPEVLWRSRYGENSDIEKECFPPSLYGNGRINPTQNLVDAFPMANGYPITETAGNYDPANPYANRDPRLALYIVTNGSTLGINGSVINTGTDAANNDGINKESGHSTRTGYYMRKLLRNDASPDPTSTVNKNHATTYIRYTEIFLDYAEAANEAWGPTRSGSHGYSAYDVIKAIRARALGDGVKDGDPYLESIKGDQNKMRELIRNERRLELCFEGARFWDLRRWNADLNATAKGVSISGTSYNYIDVENRDYKDYMIYGPLPYDDVLKFSNIEQNRGW